MSLSSEPSPAIEAAGLPADPSAYRRRGTGLRWWLIIGGVLAWTVVCVIGALAIVNFGRGTDAGNTPSPINIPFVTHPPAEPAPPPTPVAAPAPPPPPVVIESVAESAQSARLDRLEAEQKRSSQAAAAALAAASLAEAAQMAAPFDRELAAAGPLLPADADIGGLQRLARQGAPTRAALAAEYADIISNVAQAAHEPAQGAGVMARFGHALSHVVSIRRVSGNGTGADAVLIRAQRKLEDGDLAGAVADLDKLSAPARQVLAPWRERAQRRLEIDRQISALRSAALRDLAASAGGR